MFSHVPDGDTGTNMGMTITNGAKEVADKSASTVGEVAQILSKGLLMGARGNSGVITSQLFRGFGQSVKGKVELDGKDLAQAFQHGVEVAYKAVMKPVEGTILTVSRGAATAALKKAEETDDAVEVMRATLDGANRALKKTPEMLPVLKEVGVVDSGGQGLVYIYEGFLSALTGEYIASEDFEATPAVMSEMINAEHHKSVAGHVATEDITFGYCTEIMVALRQGLLMSRTLIMKNSVTTLTTLGIPSLWSTMMKSLKSMSIQKIQVWSCKRVFNMVAWSR